MLKTEIAGVELHCCVYNASGPRTGSIEALGKIGASSAGAILSKSATLVKQDGNPLPRFVNKVEIGGYCQGSINSEGLPNAGIDYCTSKLDRFILEVLAKIIICHHLIVLYFHKRTQILVRMPPSLFRSTGSLILYRYLDSA